MLMVWILFGPIQCNRFMEMKKPQAMNPRIICEKNEDAFPEIFLKAVLPASLPWTKAKEPENSK